MRQLLHLHCEAADASLLHLCCELHSDTSVCLLLITLAAIKVSMVAHKGFECWAMTACVRCEQGPIAKWFR